ncbi:MAG TPA: DUF4344 domain-containing metallopeptidase [Sphingorhabdus sp.]|jgi:hypothetical protein|uniref:DUF4344 domain-containing metallopeptidase n=1 Tax=Sphingorhabdus sp. TaxID=1902408 RepID=UPI002CCCC403|nr:DUF4344 domain-containing metallopeptidase [Sphingorhabdus sp.]HMT40012.1 DUF4344 domain-containing metallopeptidase [Sphingorhabdus sp.]HMU20764.1 DUF4344 domain-containing metallopeptidase [Sphingorhabdus sp.]
MKQRAFSRASKGLVCTLAFALCFAPAHATQDTAGGTISVSYAPGIDEASDELATILRDAAIFEDLANGVSETIRLPADLSVQFRNCDTANAFYEPRLQQLVMCYELMGMLAQNAAAAGKSDEEIGQDMMFASIFFFYHEMGHALVHQLDLPITGKEEDAVDDMAALLLLENNEDGSGGVMIASVVQQFGELAMKMADMDSLPFWGQHSLDAQRMYHLMCMIYGSNSEAYADLVSDDILPKERAEQCPYEYKQRARNWERLMENHLKPEPA